MPSLKCHVSAAALNSPISLVTTKPTPCMGLVDSRCCPQLFFDNCSDDFSPLGARSRSSSLARAMTLANPKWGILVVLENVDTKNRFRFKLRPGSLEEITIGRIRGSDV